MPIRLKSKHLTKLINHKYVEEQRLLLIAVGNSYWYSHFKDRLAIFYKTKHSVHI